MKHSHITCSASKTHKDITNNGPRRWCLNVTEKHLCPLDLQTYNDPVDAKGNQTAQPSPHMLPANQPLYNVPHPPQPSSPYLGPGGFPLADLQSYPGHVPRHALSRTLSQSQMLPSISASPPSSFQISPPMHPHQQLSLQQSSLLNQPIRMQQVQSQQIISHQMGLQPSIHSPPPGQQVRVTC